MYFFRRKKSTKKTRLANELNNRFLKLKYNLKKGLFFAQARWRPFIRIFEGLFTLLQKLGYDNKSDFYIWRDLYIAFKITKVGLHC